MRKFTFVVLAVIFSLACGQTTPSDSDIQTAIAKTQIAQSINVDAQTPTPSYTQSPTLTPGPTKTPEPTITPKPTITPEPTATPTPPPEPLAFEGQGDDVLDLEKWEGPAILHISAQQSTSNFVVKSYDSNGETIDLLVNTIGAYGGTLPLDFRGEHTARLQIQAEGPWAIVIFPLAIEYINLVELPTFYEGKGDDLLFLKGNPDLGTFQTSQERGNFVVHSYGDTRDLLVNEIAPYQGTVIIPTNTIVLAY